VRFNLITNLANDVGLHHDHDVIRRILTSAGHQVTSVDFRRPAIPRADVSLFLEVVIEQLLDASPRNWVMPNPEWWYDEYQRCLPRIDRVLCKTHHAQRLFHALVGDRAQHVGFMARDLWLERVPRVPRFLHIAARSGLKNTEAILAAWASSSAMPPLVVVTQLPELRRLSIGVRGVKTHDRVSDDQLAYLMNNSLFHLCPSKYEGFGHHLHEALGVGGVVITSDGSPMNELPLASEQWIRARPGEILRMVRLHDVDPIAIADRVRTIAQLSTRRLAEISLQARRIFEEERASFPRRLLEVVGG
jgi:Glycosyl transferases group 1